MKKICAIIHNRANYGSIKSVLLLLKKNKSFKLQIIVGGSANLERFGSVIKVIKNDKFKIDKKTFFPDSINS